MGTRWKWCETMERRWNRRKQILNMVEREWTRVEQGGTRGRRSETKAEQVVDDGTTLNRSFINLFVHLLIIEGNSGKGINKERKCLHPATVLGYVRIKVNQPKKTKLILEWCLTANCKLMLS